MKKDTPRRHHHPSPSIPLPLKGRGKPERLRTCLLLFLQLCFVVASHAAAPLTNAHSHNDYEHNTPLYEALSHGFWSVEADIWLTNRQLLVAHDFKKTQPDRTLESLYLKPLEEFVRTNAAAFKAGPLTLLIDVKGDATNTWLLLREVLSRYTNMLTRFDAGGIHTNSIMVILSGNRATQLIASELVRYAAVDGRLSDLNSRAPVALMPLVSENWTKTFTWRGEGDITDAERFRLRDIVQQAHEQGRRIRFWAAPDSPAGWAVLRKAGVDLLNTDKLSQLEEFLRKP